jgi:prepilin-type N-terminal cleavage/methylation domain-containing protein
MKSSTIGHNMKDTSGTSRVPRGFSLAEVLAALTIGAMLTVAVLGIYNRAEKSATAMTRKLDGSRLPGEVLQRIAEDLDNIISSNSDAKITIENKAITVENAVPKVKVPAARLTITRTFQDSKDNEQKFEEIVWQSSYDFQSAGNGLILYRSHSGMNLEDKVLEKNKDDFAREVFVPLCGGVTFFKISALAGKEPVERWNGNPPRGIVVTISFAEPYKKVDGTLDVLDEEKITRTIAIDRTRKIRFDISAGGDNQGEEGIGEATEDMNMSGSEKTLPSSTKKAEKVK